MGWKDEYERKRAMASEAVKKINSGDTVTIGSSCAEPQTLIEALVKDAPRLRNVKLITMIPMGECEYAKPGMEESFSIRAFSVSSGLIDAVREGRAEYIPTHMHQIPLLFSEKKISVDVAMVQVSLPDNDGFCSLGISVDFTKSAVENAKLVIAEVNEKMPKTYGDTFIHMSKFECIVESSRPLLELKGIKEPNSVERTIGNYTAELIPYGAALQIGIGEIPNAILNNLKDHRDLGIHTGMISDGMEELYLKGVITNSLKKRHKGKMVATSVIGLTRLFEFVNNNPAVELYPSNYTHDVCIIGEIENFISINSALQIDLTAQVNAESISGIQVSGVGGQVDFIRGSNRSRGGKAIIVLYSTAVNGKVSRIVPQLEKGTPVTTLRSDIDYIVTEFGIAHIKGKSLRERAKSIASIAHPQFREELKRFIQNM